MTKDKTLPQSQARLAIGLFKCKFCAIISESSFFLCIGLIEAKNPQLMQTFDHTTCKGSCAASYGSSFAASEIDEASKLGSQMAPRLRSQAQAYYICWCWAVDASNALASNKRQRVSCVSSSLKGSRAAAGTAHEGITAAQPRVVRGGSMSDSCCDAAKKLLLLKANEAIP